MRDSNYAGIVIGVGCGTVRVHLGGDPGIPWTAVHYCVPGVVAGMVGLRALLPAGCDGTLYARVLFLDIVDGIRIKEITARGLGPEAELLVELAEDVVDYLFLGLLIEHPDAEVLGLVLILLS